MEGSFHRAVKSCPRSLSSNFAVFSIEKLGMINLDQKCLGGGLFKLKIALFHSISQQQLFPTAKTPLQLIRRHFEVTGKKFSGKIGEKASLHINLTNFHQISDQKNQFLVQTAQKCTVYLTFDCAVQNLVQSCSFLKIHYFSKNVLKLSICKLSTSRAFFPLRAPQLTKNS